MVVKVVFDDGFFHADPHPGNLFIETGGRIGLIDFGMVGEVDDRLRGQLRALLLALTRCDPDRLESALLDLSVTKLPVDRERLRADLTRFISLYAGRQLGQIDIGPLIRQMLAMLRDHHLLLPREMAMLVKMVLMTEGINVLKPYAQQLVLEQFAPWAFAQRLGKAGLEAVELGSDLPENLRRIFDLIDGGVEVHLRAAELEPLVGRVERVGNRLVAGMITAAFIRGIGELTAGDKERWGGWEIPLMNAGVGAAGALSACLAWTARRNRRGRGIH